MLDMGFLPSIRKVVRNLPKKRQTLLFSATLSKEIESLTKEFQHQPEIVQCAAARTPPTPSPNTFTKSPGTSNPASSPTSSKTKP